MYCSIEPILLSGIIKSLITIQLNYMPNNYQ
jgi:hypothetical protein